MEGTWSIPDNCDGIFEISLSAKKWAGYFEQNGEKSDMKLNMGVSGGGIFGTGSDSQGAFVLRGTTDGDSFNFVKQYLGAHQVMYFGKQTDNKVKGKWNIPGNCEGTFALKQG